VRNLLRRITMSMCGEGKARVRPSTLFCLVPAIAMEEMDALPLDLVSAHKHVDLAADQGGAASEPRTDRESGTHQPKLQSKKLIRGILAIHEAGRHIIGLATTTRGI
jgi:hypothetical protein